MTLPYDPAVLDAFPATAPRFTAWLESGELRKGVWCTGRFGGTARGVVRRWEGECRGFELQDNERFPAPRTYVLFVGRIILPEHNDYVGPWGTPADQFVVVG